MTDKAFHVKKDLVVNNNVLTTNSASGRVGINNSNPTMSLVVTGTDGMLVPSGNNAQRIGANGAIRYNTELGKLEGYSRGAWVSLDNGDTALAIAIALS